MKVGFCFTFLLFASFLFACGGAPNANQSNSNIASHDKQVLAVVDRPQKIKDLMSARGQQDAAAPTLKIVEPKANAIIASSTVRVKLELSGDLKGYEITGMNMETGMGNHIHVILDNQAYEAYYNIAEPFELRNVSDGEHTLRIFPSRPWHESFKNDGAFQIVRFAVKNGGADSTKPTTTNTGKVMSNANRAPEGKEMKESTAGAVDPTKPLLTYSRPKGEYKGADADAIMIDFWLTNATLVGDDRPIERVGPAPSLYRVRYSIDGGEPRFIDKWHPIWLAGWTAGKHSIKLELVDDKGNVVDNGGYNATTREITVTR